MKTIDTIIMENKRLLVIYTSITFLFYLILFAFFRYSLDAPVDIILAVFYIMIMPGVIVLLALLKNDYDIQTEPREYYSVLLIAVLVSTVFSMGYTFLTLDSIDYLDMLMCNTLSLPLMFVAVILSFEYKSGFKNILIKFIILFVYAVIYYILSMLLKGQETWRMMQIINVIFVFVIPFGVVEIWYRRKA